ncbi:hypothetical protein TNCV_2694161 [Trichonephila clavipes]|nr:hypothetical protein TNCV_2694161 [Trichonephila clavipes]
MFKINYEERQYVLDPLLSPTNYGGSAAIDKISILNQSLDNEQRASVKETAPPFSKASFNLCRGLNSSMNSIYSACVEAGIEKDFDFDQSLEREQKPSVEERAAIFGNFVQPV